MVVHPVSTNDAGLRAAVKAPVRRPDGTWNIKFTVAVFRLWRGSQATIASDPVFDAEPCGLRAERVDLHAGLPPRQVEIRRIGNAFADDEGLFLARDAADRAGVD